MLNGTKNSALEQTTKRELLPSRGDLLQLVYKRKT